MLEFLTQWDLTFVLPMSIGLLALIVGSVTDMQRREVPDWVSFGLIGIGFGLNGMISIVYQTWWPITNSILGFAALYAVAWIMFYTGQWGGGDSKVLMGLGAVIGIDFFSGTVPWLAHFFVNLLIVGALYGLGWSVFLAIKHNKKFLKFFKQHLKSPAVHKTKWALYIAIAVLLAGSIVLQGSVWGMLFPYAALIILLTFYLFVSIRAVEQGCMLKYLKPDQLTEGDWIAKDVVVDKKVLAGPKDLGIEKKQIAKLKQLYKQKKVKLIQVKEGIPFIPSFLIAYILTILVGNIMFAWL